MLWTNEREIPIEILELLDDVSAPKELIAEIYKAKDELDDIGAVSYPTKAKIEHYLHKYSETISE